MRSCLYKKTKFIVQILNEIRKFQIATANR